MERSDVEAVIVRRIGQWMAAAGLDSETIDGTNADLADPIDSTLRQLEAGDASDVTTIDLMLDLVEYRALVTTYRNYTKVDVDSPLGGAKLDELRQAMNRAIADKKSELRQRYGVVVGTSYAVSNQPSW
jgi:hypothetical protein